MQLAVLPMAQNGTHFLLTEKRSWKANPWIGLQLSCVEDQRVLLQMVSRSILTCHSSYKDEEGLDCFYRPNAGASRALRPNYEKWGSSIG